MSLQQILSNWEDYASIKTWKKSLKFNSYNNRLSKKTEESIRTWMPLFIKYTQLTPDQLIEEALAGKHVVKERLSDFCSWLQDERKKKLNASVHGSYHVIRGFYSHNDINTQKIRTPKIDPSEVQFSDDRVPLFEIVEVIENNTAEKKKQLRRDFIQKFFACLIKRDKIIAMCIKDSGLDSGDILELPLSIIRYQDPSQERIFIRITRNKTREVVSTFWSKETTKLVKEYERMYRKNASDNEPIFVQSSKEFKIEFHKKNHRQFEPSIDDLELSAVDPHGLSRNFRNATIKLEKELELKILQREKQSPLRPKRFRKLFNDACDYAGIPTDIKRVFMGKKDPSNKPYEGKSRLDLEIYYEKVEPILSVYDLPPPQNNDVVNRLEQRLIAIDAQLQRDKIINEEKIKYLEEKLSKQNS